MVSDPDILDPQDYIQRRPASQDLLYLRQTATRLQLPTHTAQPPLSNFPPYARINVKSTKITSISTASDSPHARLNSKSTKVTSISTTCAINTQLKYHSPGSERIASLSAGSSAPGGGLFFDLKSSQICSMVTHSTPSCWLICSITLGGARQHTAAWLVVLEGCKRDAGAYRSSMNRACGWPLTSGCTVTGKMNSSYSLR